MPANPITQTKLDEITNLEIDPILAKKIIGASDVDIAMMINTLGISDWVKEGLPHFDALKKQQCPFCQQDVLSNLSNKFEQYFNEAFEEDIEVAKTLLGNYEIKTKLLCGEVEEFVAGFDRQEDVKVLQRLGQILRARTESNVASIKNKVAQASISIVLETSADILVEIRKEAERIRAEVSQHNQIVRDFATEKDKLVAEVWRYILDTSLGSEISRYQTQKRDLEKAIDSLRQQIEDIDAEIREVTKDIQAQEKRMKSVAPTILEINKTLSRFGFTGFKLSESEEKMYYSIVRSDGSKVGTTLSEGEKTFIAFLYFYKLLDGSHDEAAGGINADRVVVFDDPVSSLDSDILFIVSSLIRELVNRVRRGEGAVKQVFVLTHNIYFHKEVTFKSKPKERARKGETFWVIKKIEDKTHIEKHPDNPIRTSYELLWKLITSDKKCPLTIPNTLRRILESYFKMMGNICLDDLSKEFEGKEQFVCKSLLSWAHDGSHGTHDDLYISIDASTVSLYLKVFKEIFYKMKHDSHYEMMMECAVDVVPVQA